MFISSITKILPWDILKDKADFKAILFIFSFKLFFQLFGLGPWATAPPTQIGLLIDPWRALPVPFCLQGLVPPPDTSDLLFVEDVPCLWFNWYILIYWSKTSSLGLNPNTSSFNSICSVFSPLRLNTSNFIF